MNEQNKFNQLLSRMQDDADLQNKFLSNPSAVLQHLDIPIIDNLHFPKALSDNELETNILSTLTLEETTPPSDPAITMTKHWWGINIQWSEQFTNDYINNLVKLHHMQEQIALAAQTAKMHTMDEPLSRAFAMAFMAKSVDIRMTNKKKGVHWPITWRQMALIVAQPNVIGALTYTHPLHN